MDTEFKILILFLIFLLGVCTLLLEFLAKIHFLSPAYLSGFLPFFFLISPYILFSSQWLVSQFRNWVRERWQRKFLLPLYLLSIYTIFSYISSNFNGGLFLRLFLWLFLPVLLFLKEPMEIQRAGLKEILVVLLLWFPIEFGLLPGFDVVFNKDVTIPALAFAAPLLGLYLFTILRVLPQVGFTFRLTRKDIAVAGSGLAILALLLIPLGTRLGFIRVSLLYPSVWESLQLILGIYFLVAVPEELLFRGIVQNLLAKFIFFRYPRILSLMVASVIFGLAHWNNVSPPDWRYVFLATIAGIVYGACYLKTGKTTVSALVHCGVNFLWAVLFKETSG
ncbi:MAG: CPBP family intramembrane metalloprotease [Elusimicrobia bacterium]|nr:CPBP family intramembrane metalloprotease [Elusimicrobiota bacterium]